MKHTLINRGADLLIFSLGVALLIGITAYLMDAYEELIALSVL